MDSPIHIDIILMDSPIPTDTCIILMYMYSSIHTYIDIIPMDSPIHIDIIHMDSHIHIDTY